MPESHLTESLLQHTLQTAALIFGNTNEEELGLSIWNSPIYMPYRNIVDNQGYSHPRVTATIVRQVARLHPRESDMLYDMLTQIAEEANFCEYAGEFAYEGHQYDRAKQLFKKVALKFREKEQHLYVAHFAHRAGDTDLAKEYFDIVVEEHRKDIREAEEHAKSRDEKKDYLATVEVAFTNAAWIAERVAQAYTSTSYLRSCVFSVNEVYEFMPGRDKTEPAIEFLEASARNHRKAREQIVERLDSQAHYDSNYISHSRLIRLIEKELNELRGE